jgi:DNA repair exonuclease SbcCD ATPase subunit
MVSNEENIKEKLQIPAYAKVKVYWDDRPENYSREGRNRVKSHFSRKYGVHKNNVNVVFRPVKIDTDGNTIEITGAGIDNIMDVNYQRELFKEWLDRESKDVPFDRIVKLDESVNADLDVDLNQLGHRKWEIKWLKINNFLCFGEDNYVNFGKLRGLTIINSNPANQGGKTSFSVDAIKFLLFGKTTKTDTNDEVFNTYSDKDKLVVRGMINFDDKDIIIERVMTRTPKRKGGWNIKNKLTYYKLMPDGEEIPLEEEHATATTAEISKMIGSESDFDITILATAKNLEDLIDASPTQSGKLLTKFIGLEVIEKKESIARKMHNDFSKKMKSNIYDIATLQTEIEEHQTNIEEGLESMSNNEKKLEITKSDISKLNDTKDKLLTSKKPVDSEVSQLNPSKIESDINTITNEGKGYANEIEKYNAEIKDIGDVSYDEIEYFDLTKEYNTLEIKLNTNRDKKKSHESMIDQLKNGEICPTCKRPLDDVDHSGEIKEEEGKINQLDSEYEVGSRKLKKLEEKIDKLTTNKKKVDQKNQIELKKDRAEVEIEGLRNQIKEKKVDLKKYKANEDAINHNISVDSEIEAVKTNINVKDNEKDGLIRTIQTLDGNITKNREDIVSKEKLITAIRKEKEVDRIFKIYIEMIGKKGISKLVLRSVLPIINSELYRLMEDVVDFTVELNINDKNNVEFVIIKDEVEKQLKSGSGLEKTAASLALRCVLGKMSNLPMPNFVTFDEVFGKVAEENIEKMKPMFDKIKGMFDIVF